MQIQNCVSISQVVLRVVVRRVIPKMGTCDFCALGFKREAEKKDFKSATSKPAPFTIRRVRHPQELSIQHGRVGHPPKGLEERKEITQCSSKWWRSCRWGSR